MLISLPSDAVSRFDLLYKKAASLGLDGGQFGEKLPVSEPIYLDIGGTLQQVDSTVNVFLENYIIENEDPSNITTIQITGTQEQITIERIGHYPTYFRVVNRGQTIVNNKGEVLKFI
jgi:hypothetical protein